MAWLYLARAHGAHRILWNQKSDGSPHFITDFRKVSAVMVADSCPRVEDCIDSISAVAYVTKLELLKGYWQVPLTDLASADEFLQYTVMMFGMCNAPATFQRLVNTVLGDVLNCTAYLDDLVVYTGTWEEHVAHLHQVFLPSGSGYTDISMSI